MLFFSGKYSDSCWATKKPDSDNIIKIVLDGLNKVAYYDDSQVCKVNFEKKYADIPRVEVKIKSLEEKSNMKTTKIYDDEKMVYSGNCYVNTVIFRGIIYDEIKEIKSNGIKFLLQISNGKDDITGNCAKCVVSASIASVNNGNTKSFQIKYKKISETEWNAFDLDNTNYTISTTQIIQNIDTESEYNFKIIATDFFSFAEYSHNLSTAYTLVDYNQSGKAWQSVRFQRRMLLKLMWTPKLQAV